MSIGAVIRYAMTLDGAQYMQELRKTIAETKAAEQAMKAEAKAMGVIAVSGGDVNKALAAASGQSATYSSSISGALNVTRGFNAAQSALAQALGGNFVGAARSATVATKSFNAALAANPILIFAGAVAGAALAVKDVVDRMNEYKSEMASIRAEHEAFARSVAEMEGNDPISVARRSLDEQAGRGIAGRNNIQNQRADIDSQVAVKKQELEETEAALRSAQERSAQWATIPGATWVGGDMFGKRAEQLKSELEAKTKEYRDLLELQQYAKDAESGAVGKTANTEQREREYKLRMQYERDAIEAAKTEEDRKAIRERLAIEETARRQAEENAAASEVDKLEVRKKNLVGDYLLNASRGSAQGDLEATKSLLEIRDVEKEIAALKKAAAEQTEAEGKQRLADAAKLALAEATVAKEKAQGRADAAKADIMNPGEAKRAEREAEREKRREELREKARMTGNSEEARARRKEYESAQWELMKASAQEAVIMDKIKGMGGDPAVETAKNTALINEAIKDLSNKLIG